MRTSNGGLEQLSAFQLKDELIRLAREEAEQAPAAHKFVLAIATVALWIVGYFFAMFL